jgi:hypothetical protein
LLWCQLGARRASSKYLFSAAAAASAEFAAIAQRATGKLASCSNEKVAAELTQPSASTKSGTGIGCRFEDCASGHEGFAIVAASTLTVVIGHSWQGMPAARNLSRLRLASRGATQQTWIGISKPRSRARSAAAITAPQASEPSAAIGWARSRPLPPIPSWHSLRMRTSGKRSQLVVTSMGLVADPCGGKFRLNQARDFVCSQRIDSAFRIQSEFAQTSFEGFVAQATKDGRTLFQPRQGDVQADFDPGGVTFKPFEVAIAPT